MVQLDRPIKEYTSHPCPFAGLAFNGIRGFYWIAMHSYPHGGAHCKTKQVPGIGYMRAPLPILGYQ